MIITELCDGQGLGNQLWSYVFIRTLALDRGLEFGIMNPEKFKGKNFITLDYGKKINECEEGDLPNGIDNYYIEKDIWYGKYQCDIRDCDYGLLTISDNTKIGGYFQSEKFIEHRKKEIINWLQVNPEYDCYELANENICILNIRGGEYKGDNELILPRKYWIDAINNMRKINSRLEFIIITDDVKYAKRLLPEYKSYHFNIGKDYSIVKNAMYLILSNSSFGFFPAWTNEKVKHIIAPKYWARHNVSDGFWACAFNLYENWMWQDREGGIFTYDQCVGEYELYKQQKGIALLSAKPNILKMNAMEYIWSRILSKALKIKRMLMV